MKIGDFAFLVNLSVKTVRYYSDIGLLTPERINSETSYREYGIEQIAQVGRISALKEAGFSLGEIKRILSSRVSKKEYAALLTEKLRMAENERRQIDEKIVRIKARISQIEFEEDYRKMAEVSVRKVKSVCVASIREKGKTDDEFSHNFGIVSEDAKKHGIREIGAWMFITHDEEGDWEACAQIECGYVTDNPKSGCISFQR